MTRKYTKRHIRRWGEDVVTPHHQMAGYDAYSARRCAAKAAAAHKCIDVITNIISTFFYPYHLERKDYRSEPFTQCNGRVRSDFKEGSCRFSVNDSSDGPGRVSPGVAEHDHQDHPATARRFFHAIPGTWVIVLPRKEGI